MQKLMMYASAVLAIALVAALCLKLCGAKNADNIEFLKSYGWEVISRPIETADVTIPETFDAVFENYNALQLQAGLNLKNYCGKKGTRYTYEVTNYPVDVGETVRANLIVIDNTPVAGDIMTTSLNGFMHSLYHAPVSTACR